MEYVNLARLIVQWSKEVCDQVRKRESRVFDKAAKVVEQKWMVLLDPLVAVRGCCTGLQFSAHPAI